jgi:hypothetical protein
MDVVWIVERREKSVVIGEGLQLDWELTSRNFQLPSFLPCASSQSGLQFSFFCSLFVFSVEHMDKFHKFSVDEENTIWKVSIRGKHLKCLQKILQICQIICGKNLESGIKDYLAKGCTEPNI